MLCLATRKRQQEKGALDDAISVLPSAERIGYTSVEQWIDTNRMLETY